MIQYCKALTYYAKVYFHQVKEAFHDPPTDCRAFYSLEPGEWVFFSGNDTWERLPLNLVRRDHSGSPPYPDGSQTSETWTLGPHLPVVKGSSKLLELHTSRKSKVKIGRFLPRNKWHLEVDSSLKITDQDLYLQYEIFISFTYLLSAFSLH